MREECVLLILLAGLGVCWGNRFQEAWVMNCEHTFPDGSHFDLRPLTRTAGRTDYVGRDKTGNFYYMNICSNVQEIPHECRILQKDIASPVYQVSRLSPRLADPFPARSSCSAASSRSCQEQVLRKEDTLT